MADIELVIKIPEAVYKKAKETHDAMCDSVCHWDRTIY